jgi:1,4-alpha-glucan branching enzyme
MRAASLLFGIFCAWGCGTVGESGAPPPAMPRPDGGATAPDAGAPISAPGFVGTLGAIPFDGGVTFRVWAPGADGVSVAGDFNQFTDGANPLARTDGGVFTGAVAGATVGQKYQFVVHHGSDTLTRQDPRARQVASTSGPGVIVDPAAFSWTSSWQMPPPEKRVIYELHLGTFNPPADTVKGTFATAAAKLDYLAALGVNLIELMPPVAFPTTTSWGYNPNFPFALAQPYGTPDDLRHFVDAAHAHGIGVIVDVVYNHFSSRQQPLDCFDGVCNLPAGDRGIYFYSAPPLASTPWGPRPDFARPEVRDYIRDNALLWLTEYRCDGLRWDSVSNIRGVNNGASPNPDGRSMIVEIMNGIHMKFPHSLQIAEDLATIDDVTRPTAQGGVGFDTQWDAAFFHPIDDTVIAGTDSARSMPAIRDAITHRYNASPLERVVYSEDHDEVANGRSRIPEMISPGDAGSLQARLRSTLAAAIVMTSPGVPMIFMGQEFLESGHFSDTIALDWTKATTYAGILAEYTDLIALRKNAGGATAGLTGANVSVFHVNDTAKVIAFHRWKSGGPGDDVVVVANFSAKPFTAYTVGLPRGGTWRVRFHSDAKKYSPDYADTPAPDLVADATTPRDGFAQSAPLPLGAYEVVILSQ